MLKENLFQRISKKKFQKCVTINLPFYQRKIFFNQIFLSLSLSALIDFKDNLYIKSTEINLAFYFVDRAHFCFVYYRAVALDKLTFVFTWCLIELSKSFLPKEISMNLLEIDKSTNFYISFISARSPFYVMGIYVFKLIIFHIYTFT